MNRAEARRSAQRRGQLELFAQANTILEIEPVPPPREAVQSAAAALTLEAATVAAPAPGLVLIEAAEHPDQAARDRIARDLGRNLLVEAGAGAGKTTEMVTRMVALVRSGHATVERIAAVTFTRKAAAELRERFQTVLETELRASHAAGREDVARIDRALRDIDRAFIGTIHSFCARLLRERPLDAGLDPGFRETLASEKIRLTREFWGRHIERLAGEGDPGLAELDTVGLQAKQLFRLFEKLTEYPDVEFPAEPLARPDTAAARAELESLLDEGHRLMPRREPEDGWDELQQKVRMLAFHQRFNWSDDLRFLDALAQAFSSVVKSAGRRDRRLVTRKAWPDGDAAMELGRRFEAFATPGGAGGRLLVQWYAYRYPVALAFARRAALDFEAERRRRGMLFFEDLLMLSARLLRGSAAAREELATRYPYLLVDEFQDTDPLQAEVLFLLAADPALSQEATDWRKVVPRPGSLFVVGDPKQSIYRFRRADIALYNQIKRRFRSFGEVLELTSNFRSGPRIERFVNEVFERRLAVDETEHQAPFAPMRVVREPVGRHAVTFYTLVRASESWPREAELAAQDAERVASWIAGEVARGARKPGDFMVLTRRKKFLDRYAQAVEARNLPVQVTGAGIGIELELRELQLLLEALADPGDARLTVAVLVGLFFGLDYEQLAAHVLEHGGRFSFLSVPDQATTEVEQALVTLHRFWRLARHEPADVVVARIVDELGLLPFAAAGDLADSRAGALLFVLEAVRAAALSGEASLKGALDAIATALETDEAEAPLVPARHDVVRIMNLHQAKGLEAPVVILAEPFGEWDHAPALHVTRGEDGSAIGWLAVTERGFNFTDTTLARPLEWEHHEEAERRFAEAEADRLLYVAATRARDELLVGSYHDDRRSPWGAFFPYLLMNWPRLDLPIAAPPERDRLEIPAAVLDEEVSLVAARRRALALPTYHAAPVTRRVKADAETASNASDKERDPEAEKNVDSERPAGRGPEWGTAVHGALEAAARGVAGDQLRAVCRALLIAAERQVAATGEPRELDELVAIIESVRKSAVWERAESAQRTRPLLVEVPFAVSLSGEEYATLAAACGVPAITPLEAAPTQIIEGVIDLAFRDEAGWVIVDYKSDVAAASIEPERLQRYRAQVSLYAAAWERLSGERVAERVLLFTADGGTICW